MICPDGSSVTRSGPRCEFVTCPTMNLPAPGSIRTEEIISSSTTTSSTSTLPLTETKKEVIPSTKKTVPPKPTIKKPSSVVSFVQETVSFIFGNNTQKETPVQEKKTSQTSNSAQETNSLSAYIPKAPIVSEPINETRYQVVNNKIVDQNNTVVATIPFSNSSGSNNHVVNAIQVNHVVPLVGAIPVNGTVGKYYVSENSYDSSGCIFSNRIYIFDTSDNSKVLMYEESNTTLGEDDPRACINEMFLLATDNEKLVLKYHTVNTNMICESTWSEPEKTWYLDVTSIQKNTKHYVISNPLYQEAETKEASCRALLTTESASSTQATTTP